MYYAYVLRSVKCGRFYKGSCCNLEIRLKEHNAGKTISSKPFIPWEVAYFEVFESMEEAHAREKYFKTAAGRRFLNKHL